MSSKIVTANRLRDGSVVFLGSNSGWSERIAGAEVATDAEEAEHLMAVAVRESRGPVVVEPYLIDVTIVDGGVRPVRTREQVRASGPSVRPDLCNQIGGD